jgi:hypothetical protein
MAHVSNCRRQQFGSDSETDAASMPADSIGLDINESPSIRALERSLAELDKIKATRTPSTN